MSGTPIVHVVDDNAEIRKGLALLLTSVGIDVRDYAAADEFLERFAPSQEGAECALLDVRLPGMSGMVLLERLRDDYPQLPVIIITGHGDIDMAVRAMKLGAVDFVSKPVSSQALIDRVQDALRQAREAAAPSEETRSVLARWETLTPREREIFSLVVSGASSRVIAQRLGISARTVESHRAHIMEKMDAATLVDLVHASVRLKSAGIEPG